MPDKHTLALDVFLCMPASAAAARDGTRGCLLPVRDPSGLLVEMVRAYWPGDEAEKFLHEHAADLRPGRGLALELHSIQLGDGCLRARVASARLLPKPPSWLKHEQQDDADQQPPQAQPA